MTSLCHLRVLLFSTEMTLFFLSNDTRFSRCGELTGLKKVVTASFISAMLMWLEVMPCSMKPNLFKWSMMFLEN